MTIHWTIDSRSRLVEAVTEGLVDAAEFDELLDVTTAPVIIGFRKLFDGTEGEPRITDNERMALGARIRGLHASAPRIGPLAIVVPEERHFLVARTLGILAVPERPFRLFSDVDKARAWLDSPAIVATLHS